MADGAGPSDNKGRRKFAPTVPSRRKKASDGAGDFTAADAAAANEAFSDLIRAAQTESKWQRGRGRGFGRGRGGLAQQVTFGGGDESNVRPIAGTRTAAASGRLQGLRGDGSGVKREAKGGKAKADPGKPAAADDKRASRAFDAGFGGEDDERDEPPLSTFDFSQYFPSSLPMPRYHPLDDSAYAYDESALMRMGVPQDLVLQQDEPESTAQQLGLSDLSGAEDMLFLFKLPSALPFAVPAARAAEPDDKAHRRSKAAQQQQAAAAAAAASAAAAAGGMSRAASIRELPSGPIGKLLIFQSGKVKLQIGEVLLDVTAGMPCIARQDVVALNSHSKVMVQLGSVAQRAVVCPDVWQLMADGAVPQYPRAAGVAGKGARRRSGLAAAAAADGPDEEEEEEEELVDGHADGVNGAAAKAAVASSDEGEGMQVDGAAAAGRTRQRRNGVQNGTDKAAAAADGAADGAGPSSSSAEDEQEGSEEEEEEEDDAAAAAAAAAAAKADAAQKAAAAAAAEKQRAAPPDPLMGVLGLPSTRAAAGGARGRGRFKPSAARGKKDAAEAMDVD